MEKFSDLYPVASLLNIINFRTIIFQVITRTSLHQFSLNLINHNFVKIAFLMQIRTPF